jgi:uncharacterized protein (AIM24 family)
MGISFEKGAQRLAAIATLTTASIGSSFAQEAPESSSESGKVTATAPRNPSTNADTIPGLTTSEGIHPDSSPPLTPEELTDLLKRADEILAEKSTVQDETADLKTNTFPKRKGSDQDLLLKTLGDFNPEDFDTTVTRTYSLDAPGAPVFTYRLTCVRTNSDPEDTLKASSAYIDYKLPVFEAVKFEDSLEKRGFEIVSKRERPTESSNILGKEPAELKKPELTETEKKVVNYIIAGFFVAVGSAVWWAGYTGLRMFRWMVTKNPDTPMATPLPKDKERAVAPWDSVQYTVMSGVETPHVTSPGETSPRLTYSIKGGSQPIITLQLKPGEAIITETGSLLLKDSDVSMKRVSGSSEGYTPEPFGFVKRWFMGESFWFLKYKNTTERPASLVLSPSKVGTMLGLDLAEFGEGLVADGGSFFAASRGVKLATNRILSIGGVLSGLGPFQQRLTGNGEVFLFSSGEVHELDVKKGQTLLLDPDAVFAWEPSVKVQAKWLGLWSGIVSGEGFFLCSVSGEGRLFYSSRGMRDDPAKDRTGGPTGLVEKLIDKASI